MDESKELQGLYTIFRATIYISLLGSPVKVCGLGIDLH